MPASASTDYQPEQEIRFAVVLYGGISLAIYINGVAQELLCLVRGTADLPSGEPLSGTERIYRELGQNLGRGGPQSMADNSREHPIRTRFVVDIISGTSAGGISGVALAKALALKGRDLGPINDVWLNEAQLDKLLNDAGSDPRKYPPHPSGKATSLLNSERMYGKILETLRAMNDPRQHTLDAGPFADKLDLFVTATDLTGLSAPIQLTGHKIDERVHKAVFHFEYAATSQPQGPKQRRTVNEFDSDYDAMLAFAARCTSSFPVAFEPMRFERMEHQLRAQRTGLTPDKAQERYAEFFPAYQAHRVPFLRRPFADGGYLDNRPFSYAIDLIPYRSSTRPFKRKLLFIDPFPEIHQSHHADDREISFLENAFLAAMTLPRYEVIRDDIRTINAFNRRLDRLSALQERAATDRATFKFPEKYSPPNFASLDLKAMVETYGYGEFYPLYHHLRVYDTTDVLARMVTRLAGFEVASDQYYYLRLLMRAWREAKYAVYAPTDKATENAFLYRFDTDYRLRRLNQLRSKIDQKLSGCAAPIAKELMSIRGSVEVQLAYLRDTTRELESRTRSPLGAHVSVHLLKERLGRHFDEVMGVTDYCARYCKAKKIYCNSSIQQHIDAVMDEIGRCLASVFDWNREEMRRVLPPKDNPNTPSELGDIRKAYDLFHWHDVLSLPFLEGSGAREHSEVEIYRVSPADSGFVPSAEKLAGTAVGAFGGFLQKEWREHDMMWGRLDGAERIITAILPGPADADLRQNYIRRAQDIILREEFSLPGPHGRDRIFQWLAHKLRDKNVTDRSAEDLVRQGKSLLSTFPSLAQVVAAQEFRTFLLRYYSLPPPPPPEKVADWAARSLKILGRMIDDLPEGGLMWVRGRLAGVSRFAGILLTTLLRFAVPGSMGKKLADHWLTLFALAGLLMILVGPLVSAQGIAIVGYATLLGCLVLWIALRTFGYWLRGRTRLREPAFAVVALLLFALIVLGAIKLWDIMLALTANPVTS
jgi:patatin-related protein